MRERPVYERDEDRRRASAAVEPFRRFFEVLEAPRFSPHDYEVRSLGDTWLFVEVKSRTKPWRELVADGRYMVSASKVDRVVERARLAGATALLLVVDGEGAAFVAKLPAEGTEFRTGGRTDRGDPWDVETVAFVPATAFVPFKAVIGGAA